MERMDVESRNQSFTSEGLREKYLNAKAKKEKTQILDESFTGEEPVR